MLLIKNYHIKVCFRKYSFSFNFKVRLFLLKNNSQKQKYIKVYIIYICFYISTLFNEY